MGYFFSKIISYLLQDGCTYMYTCSSLLPSSNVPSSCWFMLSSACCSLFSASSLFFILCCAPSGAPSSTFDLLELARSWRLASQKHRRPSEFATPPSKTLNSQSRSKATSIEGVYLSLNPSPISGAGGHMKQCGLSRRLPFGGGLR